MKFFIILCSFLVLFSSFASEQDRKKQLIEVLRPVIYGDWNSIKELENAGETEWFAIRIEPRMRILYHQNAMEEEFRLLFKYACGTYNNYERCWPHAERVRIYEVDDENFEVLGYVLQGYMVELPGEEPNTTTQTRFQMTYYADGTRALGPAFYEIEE